ncbi:uncharacterized protein [Asterias amurensis]|uniref:uncharacterized protein n=1 Tax=Asterias amurensis TaxID=7602 RepID=UPI003AB668FB
MGGAFTEKFAVLLVVGIMFQDAISSGTIMIDMPPVVSVFEGEDVELECKVRYADGTLIQPCDERSGLLLRWSLVNRLGNMLDEVIARCGRVASFKNKTVEFNQDNGNLTILNIGLADDAVVWCKVYGFFDSHSNMTHLKVKKGCVSFGNLRISMPPVVSVFEGDDVELECKARYANVQRVRLLGYKRGRKPEIGAQSLPD